MLMILVLLAAPNGVRNIWKSRFRMLTLSGPIRTPFPHAETRTTQTMMESAALRSVDISLQTSNH